MRTGYDVSNWTGGPTAAWDALAQSGGSVLFPQAIDPPAGYPKGVTRDQVQWGLDQGWQVCPYVWKWFGTGIDDVKRRVDLLTPFTGLLDALVLDVEDTYITPLQGLPSGTAADIIPAAHIERVKRQPPPQRSATQTALLSLQARVDELEAAYEILDAFPTRLALAAVHYTGRWYHVPYLADTTAFSWRVLHVAAYDGVADPSVFTRFGGWTTAGIKQPGGTMSVGGVGNVDPDVVADGLLEPPPPDSPPDSGEDSAWLAKKPRVVQLAGELLAVADQLDAAAEQASTVHQLADGVRDRAAEILA